MTRRRGAPKKTNPATKRTSMTRVMVRPDFKEMVDRYLAASAYNQMNVAGLFRTAVCEILDKYAEDPASALPVLEKAEAKYPTYPPRAQVPDEQRTTVQVVLLLTPQLRSAIDDFISKLDGKLKYGELYRAAVTHHITVYGKKARNKPAANTGRGAEAGQMGTLDASHCPVNGPILAEG